MLGDLILRRLETLGPTLEVRPGLCTWSLSPRSGCRACLEVCSVGALKRDGKKWNVESGCDACGACVGACPTGALDLRAPSTKEIDTRVAEDLARKPGSAVVFTCDKAASVPGAIVIPCAARLDETILFGAASRGAGTVCVVTGQCRTCAKRSRLNQVFPAVVRTTRKLLFAAGLGRRRLRVGNAMKLPAACAPGPAGTRRNFFGSLLAAFAPPEKPRVPEVSKAYGRRARLIEAALSFPGLSGRIADMGLPSSSIEINQDCIGCNVCEHVCAPGALRRDPGATSVRILFSEPLCTGCNACVEACLFGAVKLREAGPEARPGSFAPKVVAELPARICGGCGESYHSTARGRCPRCDRGAGGQAFVSRVPADSSCSIARGAHS